MSLKIAALLFLAACVAARLYRSKLAPLLARVAPKVAIGGASAGLSAVERLATHELAQLLADRVRLDADAAANRARAEALVSRLKGAIDPEPSPPPPDPKA